MSKPEIPELKSRILDPGLEVSLAEGRSEAAGEALSKRERRTPTANCK